MYDNSSANYIVCRKYVDLVRDVDEVNVDDVDHVGDGKDAGDVDEVKS